MLSDYIYPMTMLCGTALMLGRIISNGTSISTIYSSLTDAAMRSISLLAAYHIATIAVWFITNRLTKGKIVKETVSVFTGYSMTAILALEFCVGLFPILRLPALIAQFYTLKIVGEGATTMLNIDKEQLFTYTTIVSIILIALPVATSKILSSLTLALS